MLPKISNFIDNHRVESYNFHQTNIHCFRDTLLVFLEKSPQQQIKQLRKEYRGYVNEHNILLFGNLLKTFPAFQQASPSITFSTVRSSRSCNFLTTSYAQVPNRTKNVQGKKMFIKPSVARYGIEWPCMALCGLVWLYGALCGLVWPCTGFFYLIWRPMVLHGLIWHRSKFIWSCFSFHGRLFQEIFHNNKMIN